MHRLLENYHDQLSVSLLPMGQAKALAGEWQAGPVGVHLPNWLFLGRSSLEVIIKSFWMVASGNGGQVQIRTAGGKQSGPAHPPFEWLSKFDAAWRKQNTAPRAFYVGLLSFDLYRFIENLPIKSKFYQFADYSLLIPAEALIIDHSAGAAHLLKAGPGWLPEPEPGRPGGGVPNEPIFSESKSGYLKKIEHIRELIRAGEVYQVNYTIRISRRLEGSGYRFFRRLYRENPAPFSGYVCLPEGEIISNSPERFLAVKRERVITEPIKGTIRRLEAAEEDRRQQERLLSSSKDAAELNMIVDLLRNDLARVCRAGAVQVEEHRRLMSFRNVHHLVSTVSGRLRPRVEIADLLKATFPGGSISGCPKYAALKYIYEFEQHPRSFYTGNLFLRFPQAREMDSSILIRTGLVQNKQIHFQVGGGIVIDSLPEDEYEECLAKADSFLKVTQRFDDDIS